MTITRRLVFVPHATDGAETTTTLGCKMTSPRQIGLSFDVNSAFCRAIVDGLAAYASAQGPWQFVLRQDFSKDRVRRVTSLPTMRIVAPLARSLRGALSVDLLVDSGAAGEIAADRLA